MIETAPNQSTSNVQSTSSEKATSEIVSVQDCQALMLCLEGGRFVIVRVDEDAGSALTCDGKPDLRDLATGDVVAYRGRDCKVQAVEIYR